MRRPRRAARPTTVLAVLALALVGPAAGTANAATHRQPAAPATKPAATTRSSATTKTTATTKSTATTNSTATKTKPKVTVVLSPAGSVEYDGSLSAAVTVSGSKGTATGEVDIAGMAAGDCEALDLSGGRSGCSVDQLSLAPGAHTVTARYSGDRHDKAATGTATIVVTRAHTDMDLGMTPDIPVAGSPVTFDVVLSDAAGSVPNHGAVRFADDAGTIGGCTDVKVDHGYAACTTTLAAGSYTITYAFSGSPNFAPAQVSAPVAVPVPALDIVTTALPNGYPAADYAAQLQASGGTAPYTWSIAAGGLPSGVRLSRQGVLAGSPNTTGSWSVMVVATDATDQSVLRRYTLKIRPAISSDLAMTCPGATFARTTTCTLTATDTSAGPAPTGYLQYSFGRSYTDQCTLPATPAPGALSSSCTVEITWDGAGSDVADLLYGGDAAHTVAEGSATVAVAAATGGLDTTSAIRCPGAAPDTSSTCTVTVTDDQSSATPAPTGKVDFSYLDDEGEATGGSCTLVTGSSTSAGQCQIVYDFEDEVPDTVRVNYYGDARHHGTTTDLPLHTSSGG